MYYVIPKLAFSVIHRLDRGISIRNSIIFVIASEAKQSLEILDFALGILDFYLKFPTMSSSGLTRGSLYGSLEFSVMRSPDQVGG